MKDPMPGPMRRLLLPLLPLYRMALALRALRLRLGFEAVRRLRFPVVSVGNLSTGGTGKTPLTIALARALTAHGVRVDVLSRGYGRREKKAVRVDSEGTAASFGDEPLLMARATGVPVYVATQRYDAGRLAEADSDAEAKADRTGAEGRRTAAATESAPLHVHLLDDGFQHRQLNRDVNILMLNREDWRGWLLPVGNLREPLGTIRRASVLAIPADEPELEVELGLWGWQGPIWRLRRKMEVPLVASPVAAFCGIARPEQFFRGLEAAGLQIAFRRAFPDHFPYTRAALEELIAVAQARGATAVVTTAKDLARMGALAAIFPAIMPLMVAELRIEIEDEDAVVGWLINQLGRS